MATKRFKLLDLFSGAGGAARGYQLAGFHVTGVDVEPQPRYAGDEFHQADALTYPLDGFDAIHASPPCQLYSAANNIRQRDDHPGLIPAIRRRLKAAGVPYVIENVPRSPLDNYIVICGLAFPELNVKRHRWFESNVAMIVPPCGDHTRDYLIVFGGSPRRRAKQIGRTAKSGPILYRGFATADEGRAAMGIDWMNRDELSQAIPPAYTTFIGELLLAHLSAQIPRAAATPDASQRVTAGTSPFDGRAPDGPGPAAALGPRDRLVSGVALQHKSRSPERASSTTHEARAETRAVGAKIQPVTLFEAEAADPATAASPPDSGIASAATRRARPASASNLPRPVCGWSWSTTTSCGCSTLAGGSPSSRSQGVSFEPGVHDRWLRQQA